MWKLLTYIFYKDFMSNKETFMTTTIIYSLQGFHVHYGIYIVAMRLEIVLLFFFNLFTRFSSLEFNVEYY